ncbi:MAG: glycosyltransferase family 9 protein [Trueperaceae bacterium]
MPLLPEVRRIAVLRANGIGDLIFALPALAALRSAYPSAHITLLAAPWHKELLAGREEPADDVLVVPAAAGIRKGPGEDEDDEASARFLSRMRARRFDLALQMHGGGRYSNPFVSRLGARSTAGLQAAGVPGLDLNVPYVYYQSEVLRLLEVAALVGAEPVTLEPRLAVTESDLAEANAVLPSDGAPLAVLNPGASDPRRRWPPEKFAAVGDALRTAGATVAIVGGPNDRELGRAVASAMRGPACDLTGRIGLGGLAGLLSRSRLLVSNDTGPLHLGAAVGAPTVGIYWCGNLINAGPAYRRRHRPQVSWRLDCPVCGIDCTRSVCSHDASFVADVPEDQVIAAGLDLLAAGAADNQQPAGSPGGHAATSARPVGSVQPKQ